MDDEDDLPEGEMIEVDDEDNDVVDTPDGGAIVTLGDERARPADSAFYDNLAEKVIPETALSRLSSTLLDLIAKDKDARKKRDEQYEEGLRRTGLADDAPGGASFQGASRVVHPMLVTATVDFAARAMKELFPPEGPAKDFIPGETTGAKLAKAQRKTALMNWQLTVQCQNFRSELEQLLTQVPLGGAQYLKASWLEDRNRPDFLFVAIDDMYLPFAATNFYSAQRKTHVQFITEQEYERRVRIGMYRDVDLSAAGMEPEPSASGVASDKIEGRQQTNYNEDGLRTIYEVYATVAIAEDEEGGDGAAPYIISLDKASGKVLSIYRNWDEEDETREELQHFVEFPFIPWRGAYPIGLSHMIAGLSAAATGALRALLDSAHIQNVPSGLKLKSSMGGQSLTVAPTEIVEVEGGLNVDDIRKLYMPMPFNPPSDTLFQLLGFLVEAGNNVVRTSMEDIADQNPNAPVGTTLAKIEQGMVVFSAIHSRLHDAMARVLRILHRLNAMYLDDEKVEAEVGEELATRKDFDGPMDVVPVSNPNIFSEAQRYAQVQAVAQRAQLMPQLYNARSVEERILDTLKIPNPKELLAPAPEPQEMNAVNENVAATLGKPVVAFPNQDHIAHLKAHLSFMLSPALGMSGLIAPTYLPVILNHLKEHLAMWYAASVLDIAEEVTGLEDVGEVMKNHKSPEEKQAFDRMLAEASAMVAQEAQNVFAQLPQAVQQAQQLLQSMAPPPQQDPAVAALVAETQRKAQADAAEAAIKQQKLAQDAQIDAAELQQKAASAAAKLQLDAQLAALAEQGDTQREMADIAARRAMNQEDNQTAIFLAEVDRVNNPPQNPGFNPQP